MTEGKHSFTSHHYPYLPVTFAIGKQWKTVEALVDTGFEGDLVIPEASIQEAEPDSYIRYTLADPIATVFAPSYLRRVHVVAHWGFYDPHMQELLTPPRSFILLWVTPSHTVATYAGKSPAFCRYP